MLAAGRAGIGGERRLLTDAVLMANMNQPFDLFDDPCHVRSVRHILVSSTPAQTLSDNCLTKRYPNHRRCPRSNFGNSLGEPGGIDSPAKDNAGALSG